MTATKKKESKKEIENQQIESEDFIFLQGEKSIIFRGLDMGRLECPFCRQPFQRIGMHINNQNCKISLLHLDSKELTSQLVSFNEGFRLEMSKKRKQRSRTKLLDEKGPEVIKAEINRQKSKRLAKLKEEKGPEAIKVIMNQQKAKSLAKLKEERGSEVIQAEKNRVNQKSRDKLRKEKGVNVIKDEQNKQKLINRNKHIVEKGPALIRR